MSLLSCRMKEWFQTVNIFGEGKLVDHRQSYAFNMQPYCTTLNVWPVYVSLSQT